MQYKPATNFLVALENRWAIWTVVSVTYLILLGALLLMVLGVLGILVHLMFGFMGYTLPSVMFVLGLVLFVGTVCNFAIENLPIGRH